VQRDLELIGVDESVALDRGRWRKIIASPTLLKGKIWTLNKNDDDDDGNANKQTPVVVSCGHKCAVHFQQLAYIILKKVFILQSTCSYSVTSHTF